MDTWIETMTGLSLQSPALLLLALPFAAAAIWRWHRGTPALRFSPAAFVSWVQPYATDRSPDAPVAPKTPLPRSLRARLRLLPAAIQLVGLLAALVALARPVQRIPLPFESQGIDIVLCLDVSSSMAANDLDPRHDRLAVAKAAGARFVEGRADDRIGLVAFARYADLRCPPTLDHRALRQILAETSMVTSDSQEDATGIGAALARAAQVLEHGVAKSKVIVLLTDGEENVATAESPDEIAPLHAAQLCHELGVRVYAIAAGIGTRTAGGDWVAIDTKPLEEVARVSQGRFFAARDASSLANVYAEIDRLERAALAQPRTRVEERFLPFLTAGLGLLLAAWLLRRTWFELLP
ncbi:MAG: VWA domain-containing protein [Planctomycetota bacterium]